MNIDDVEITAEDDAAHEKKLPWLIDILLYPCSVSGLTHIGIFITAIIFLSFLSPYYGSFEMRVGLVVLWMIFGWYVFNYFSWCVNESASGGRRAPEPEYLSGGFQASYSDLFIDMLLLLIIVVVCFGPAIAIRFLPGIDGRFFWVLLAVGFFFSPMMLLASIMFDTLRAINPVLILGSIFSCFFKYLLMAMVLPSLFVVLGFVSSLINLVPLPRLILFCCYIYAGLAFEPLEASIACLAALCVNMSVSYALTHSIFKTPICRFLEKRGWPIPKLTEDNQFRFTFLMRTVPGPPFFFQNLTLSLAGIPFWTYLWISLLTQGSIAIGVIFCSRYLSQDPLGMGGITVIVILSALLIAKSIRSIRKRRN